MGTGEPPESCPCKGRSQRSGTGRRKRNVAAKTCPKSGTDLATTEKEKLQLKRAQSRELTLQRQKNKAMEQEIDALHEYIMKLREKTYQD